MRQSRPSVDVLPRLVRCAVIAMTLIASNAAPAQVRYRLEVNNTWSEITHPGAFPHDAHFYFVHSFYAESGPDQIASTEYIVPFASAMVRDNFHAVQFHPEKSADVGSQLLKNFLAM